MNKKTAVISGVSGQDGSYLADFLLNKGYDVLGLTREDCNLENLEKLFIKNKIRLKNCNICNFEDMSFILKSEQPDEFYNLAAQSSVANSWKDPFSSVSFNTNSVLCLLEMIKNFSPKTKVFQASSSEIFGTSEDFPQTEETEKKAISPYGLSKLFGHLSFINYRKNFNLKLYNGILYSHESPFRKETFVSRKITKYFAEVFCGKNNQPLELGNLYAKRDWGYAQDYVKAMWMIMQSPTPDDYIIASSSSYTIKDFITEISKICNIDILWQGDGVNEIGINKNTGKTIIKINPDFFRPIEANSLCGSIDKITKNIGWNPQTSFSQLCFKMLESDIKDLGGKL